MPNSLPILIVGGFGSSWQQYTPLQKLLVTVGGRPTFIAPIALFDWAAVAVTNEYTGLLAVLDGAVNRVLRDTGREKLVLLAHSAGGVLSRIYMGDQPYGRRKVVYNGFQRVATLATLGTPHQTVRKGRVAGLDQIDFVQRVYPGAYWRFIHYVTIIGQAVRGVKNGTAVERSAFQSYELIAGNGTGEGDGIVPVNNGLLAGARQLILPGVRHDPRPDHPWYGQNEALVRQWWGVVEETERGET
ncbi:MAG: lipase [Chloroflexaceae bacterium]|jgi:pimeloyl-ACP methyl ester carboxylesterase|nr:lipase [Chloroflexaceae bacterium]